MGIWEKPRYGDELLDSIINDGQGFYIISYKNEQIINEAHVVYLEFFTLGVKGKVGRSSVEVKNSRKSFHCKEE